MNEDVVVQIKYDIIAGILTQEQIASKYGIKRGSVSHIACGRTHKDVGPNMQPLRPALGQKKSPSLEDQNVSLIGQLSNVTVERNRLRRQLKTASKGVSAVEGVIASLGEHISAIPAPNRIKLSRAKKGIIDETLVLVLSDTHLDQVVTPEEVEGLEEFNFVIGARRCEVLIDSLLKFTQETLCNFRFKKLMVFGLGDYGSFNLHDHSRHSFFGDTFRDTLAIGQLFGCMFSELSPFFEEMEVVNITGNHGRLTAKHGFSKHDAAANFDDLSMRIAELHCKEHKNITFTYPEGVSSIVEVEGYNFHLSHGHTKAGGSAAWNRAKKLTQTLLPLHGGTIDYMVQGHYHTPGLVTVSGGATLIANGALLATDQYALQSLGEASPPTQFIFGVHADRGVTWRLPIQVATEGEAEGPVRYSLPCLETWDHA